MILKKVFNLILNFFNKLKKSKYCVFNINDSARVKLKRVRPISGNSLFIGAGSSCDCDIYFDKVGAGVIIGSNTFIGPKVSIISAGNIHIGNNVQIAWGTTIIDHNSHSLNHLSRRNDLPNTILGIKNWNDVDILEITIEDDVWIGFNSIILKGVTVGQGAIIAAGSIVTKNIPEFTLYGGIPAKFIKKLNR